MGPQSWGRERDLEWCDSLETSKPTPSHTAPPTMTHILILPKQVHHLGAKASNTWSSESCSYSHYLHETGQIYIKTWIKRLSNPQRTCSSWWLLGKNEPLSACTQVGKYIFMPMRESLPTIWIRKLKQKQSMEPWHLEGDSLGYLRVRILWQ